MPARSMVRRHYMRLRLLEESAARLNVSPWRQSNIERRRGTQRPRPGLAADAAGRDVVRRTLLYGPGEQADWLKPGGGGETSACRRE